MTVRDEDVHAQVPDGDWPRLDLVRRLLSNVLAGLHHGRLSIVLPSGRRVVHQAAGSGPDAVLILHSWRALRRVATRGDIGFAEGYMEGDWSTPDLTELIELFARNVDQIKPNWAGSRFSRLLVRLLHRARSNTRRGSRRNIAFHYDLGNAFYAPWLDAGMQYSSAIYAPGDTLEAAQQRKLARVEDLLALKGGERVLEIGCGWGAVAERLAAEKGCAVTGLTLSQEQLTYARDRLAGAGLSADLRLQDYRDCRGLFDRIVSVEMIEAVGEKYWGQYFELVRERLVPGGRAVIQAITIDESQFDSYRRDTDFIQRYIFPGGMLPTLTHLRQHVADAQMTLTSVESFGASYARTLSDWMVRFNDAWPQLEGLGFDLRFRRMWNYYLAYCAAGFRAGTINVSLITIDRRPSPASH